MRHFCTYFDRHYLIRGLTLYRSLKHHSTPFTLWVLCFDDFTYQSLRKMNLPELRPISLPEFEQAEPRLTAVKRTRSQVEYYFTCSPSWTRYVLNRTGAGELVTYLDADLYFYEDPAPLFDELGGESILIIGHRFPDRLKHLETYGVYNVGFLSFRNDEFGQACLDRWCQQCLAWCYDRPEDGRFADQKYLDDWPTHCQHVVVAQHKGANLAPWNWERYRVEIRDNRATVDGQPLIFYHFHGLKLLNRWIYEPTADAKEYGLSPSPSRDWIYDGYVQALRETTLWARETVPEVDLNSAGVRTKQYGWRTTASKMIRGQLKLIRSRNKTTGDDRFESDQRAISPSA